MVIALPPIRHKVRPPNPSNRLDGSRQDAAQRMIRPEQLIKHIVDVLPGGVLIHADLFQDDLAFSLDIFSGQGGTQHHIRENLNRPPRIPRGDFGHIAGEFLRGKSVEAAADPFNRLGELLAAAPAGPFEDQMLQEMGDAREPQRLVASAGSDPHADRHGLDMLYRPQDGGEPVGERRQAVGVLLTWCARGHRDTFGG